MAGMSGHHSGASAQRHGRPTGDLGGRGDITRRQSWLRGLEAASQNVSDYWLICCLQLKMCFWLETAEMAKKDYFKITNEWISTQETHVLSLQYEVACSRIPGSPFQTKETSVSVICILLYLASGLTLGNTSASLTTVTSFLWEKQL